MKPADLDEPGGREGEAGDPALPAAGAGGSARELDIARGEGGTIRQHALGYLAQLLSVALPVVQNLLFPILLGAGAFGALTVAGGFAYMPLALIEQGFVATMIWHAGGAQRPDRRLLRALGGLRLALSAGVFVSIWIAAPALSRAYDLVQGTALIRLAGLVYASIGVYSVLDTFLVAARRNDLSAIVRLMTNGACVGLPLLLWWGGRSPEAVMAGTAAGYALASVVAALVLASAGFLRPTDGSGPANAPERLKLLGSIGSFAIVYFSCGMQSWGLVALAGLLVPTEQVGFLRIAVGAVQATVSLAPVPVFVVFSYLVLFGHDPGRHGRYLSRIGRIGMLLSSATVAMAIVLSGRAVEVLFGPAFSQVAPLLAVVALAQPALLLLPLAFQSVLVLGARGRMATAFGVLLTIELAAGLVSARWLGTMGIALVLAAFPWMFLVWARRRLASLGVRLVRVGFAAPLSAGLATMITGKAALALMPGAGGLVFACAVSCATCVAILWMRGDVTREDLQEVRRRLAAAASGPAAPQV